MCPPVIVIVRIVKWDSDIDPDVTQDTTVIVPIVTVYVLWNGNGRYSEFHPWYLSWKSITIPGISPYWFRDSSYQTKALLIINLKVEIACFIHDPSSLHNTNSVFHFGLLCTNYVHGVLRYDTWCYFNVRSKADISEVNLLHRTIS